MHHYYKWLGFLYSNSFDRNMSSFTVPYEFLIFIVGKNHELHPSKEVTLLGKSISTPSIVVHVCEEGSSGVSSLIAKSKIGVRPKNTPCPNSFRQNSLE